MTNQAQATKDDAHESMARLSIEDDSSPFKQRLYLRLTKCHLYRLQVDEARDAAVRLSDASTREALLEAIETTAGLKAVFPDVTSARERVLERLPRYKPGLSVF